MRRTKTQIRETVQSMKHAALFTTEEMDEIINSSLPRLKFTNAVDLFNTEFPPIQFAVPNLIPEGLTILAGPPKIGKSFLCLNLAMSIANGGVAAGSINIEEERDVLYCAIEDSPRRIKERMALLAPDGKIPKRLHFLTQGELPTVLDEAGISILDEAVKQSGVEVVIIDTWQRVKPAKTKRDNGTIYEEDYELLGKLQAWAIKKGLAVVIVHHLRKTGDEVNPYNMISGSTGIQAAVDSMLMLNRRDGSYVLNVVGRDFDEQELGLSFEGGLWKIQGTAEEVFMSSQRAEILEVLKASNGESLSPKEIGEELDGKNVRQILSAMAKDGMIRKNGYGRYLLNEDDRDDTLDRDDKDDRDDTSPTVIHQKTQDDTSDDTLDPVLTHSEGSKTPSVNSVKAVIAPHQSNVELRSVPAHEGSDPPRATSGSVLDSLTPPQKFFLELLPIRDEAILSRYQDDGGFSLIDLEQIKEIKKFLIGEELIKFNEVTDMWQKTRRKSI